MNPTAPHDLRLTIEDLYADYADALDNGTLDRWPELFTDPCLYQIIPRENYERGLPLAVMRCESRGMLRDRVEALRRTSVFAPRAMRHLVSGIRVSATDGEVIHTQANYAVFETQIDEPTRVFNVGRYIDELVRDAGQLKFRQRLCVFDSVLVPGSLIYPV